MRASILFTLLAAISALPARALASPADGPVVRPQMYSTGNKFEVTPVVGYVSNDPYYRIIAPGVMVTYHYSDRSAIEGHVNFNVNSEKQLLSQVRAQAKHEPDVVSRPKIVATGDYVWTPVYGKLNAFGEVVLHYDLYVLGGLGISQDEIQTSAATPGAVPVVNSKVFPVTDVGLGQHFFLSRHIALRTELRPVIVWENINGKWDPNGDVQINLGLSLLF